MPTVDRATRAELGTLVDQWVALAEEQRDHGSLLATDANRETIAHSFERAIEDGRLLVARDDGELCGFVHLTLPLGSFVRTASVGTVENLYVEPDRRNAGIGTRLLEAGEHRLAELGVETVRIAVMVDNDAARRLYRRRGYRPRRSILHREVETNTSPSDVG